MGLWPKKDKKADTERHEKLVSQIRKARVHHRTWVSQEFPNNADVVRDAQYIVDDFEAEHGLTRGSIEVKFDDHGSHLGYFLIMRGTLPDEHDLVVQIREKTGESFEVDHILAP